MHVHGTNDTMQQMSQRMEQIESMLERLVIVLDLCMFYHSTMLECFLDIFDTVLDTFAL